MSLCPITTRWALKDCKDYYAGLLKQYDRTIKDQIEKGIIEAVPDGESQSAQTHYHAVVSLEPTK